MWGEIPQHQPAAGPVGAVSTPGGSLCDGNADTLKYMRSSTRLITFYWVINTVCFLIDGSLNEKGIKNMTVRTM